METKVDFKELTGEIITYVDPTEGDEWIILGTLDNRYDIKSSLYGKVKEVYGNLFDLRGQKILNAFERVYGDETLQIIVTVACTILVKWGGGEVLTTKRERTENTSLGVRNIHAMTFEDIMRYCVKYFSVDDILNEAACYEDNGKFSWEM
jgi:hypothetical protein